jgi:hypothetical protein
MAMKAKYVVLVARGPSWETNGPLATEYDSLKEAEAAARDLSMRYTQRTLGVYELRAVFGTQQKVVKQKVEAPAEQPAKRKPEAPEAENVIRIRSAN